MKASSHLFKEKTATIIVAGGSGQRMNNALPKQFLPLDGKPVLYHSIKAFVDAIPQIRIILVLPEAHISFGNMVLQQFNPLPDITIVSGGSTRFHSVKNGIDMLQDETIIFVHDGVRPLLNQRLIGDCYSCALQNGIAIPCVRVNDSIRQIRDNGSIAISRELLRAVQTPQTFRTEILREIFRQEYREIFTDEATVAEAAGHTVCLCEGDRNNIKITTPEDLSMAEILYNKLSGC